MIEYAYNCVEFVNTETPYMVIMTMQSRNGQIFVVKMPNLNNMIINQHMQQDIQYLLNKSKIILLKIKKANNVYYLPSSYKRLCV